MPPAHARSLLWLALALLCVLAGPAGAEPGSSARIALAEAERGAWAAVGRLQIGRSGHCTATLIAPDVLLTAAHCLYAQETGRPWRATRLQFQPGWWDGAGRLQLKGWAVAVAEDYRFEGPRTRPNADIALVRLAAEVPGALPPFPAAKEPAAPGEMVAVLSYGRDRPDVPSIEPGCRILNRVGGLLLTDCEALAGVSGAPLLRLRGGRAEVVGVVSSRLGPEGDPAGQAIAVAVDDYLAGLLSRLAPRR
jgi:protease YdgD